MTNFVLQICRITNTNGTSLWFTWYYLLLFVFVLKICVFFIQESESEDLELSNSCQHKEDSALQVSFERTSPQHLTRDSGPERTKLFNLESPEDAPDAPSLTSEITTKDSSDRAFRIGRRSVGSQTEDSFGPHTPPAASQLQCVYTQTTEEDEDEDVCVESPPVSPPAWGPEAGNQVLFSGSFPIPADPARLAERIRRNRTQLSAAFDDTEYEPYGLPEVVMKGTLYLLLHCSVHISTVRIISTLSLD